MKRERFTPSLIKEMRGTMKIKTLIFSGLSCIVTAGYAQQKEYPKPEPMRPGMTEFWLPQPRIVTPAEEDVLVAPPSDAVILFDGRDLSAWQHDDGSAPRWTVADGCFTVKPGTGQISTKQNFTDFQLHIEWREPEDIAGESQGRGNSGVFLQGKYEVQILDSYGNETYANGQAGSVYKQTPPLVNAMRPPGKWNVYDIIYTAPRFKADGSLQSNGFVTLLHNGVLVQNHTLIQGTTEYIGLPRIQAHGAGPLVLQDHGNPVSFRNVWIREL